MSYLREFTASLAYPLTLSFWLLLLGAALWALRRRRRWALALMCFAFAWSALWSVPLASDWLRSLLERRYPVVEESALPQADAIVVLGGGSRYAWLEHNRVDADQLENSRLAAGARAWHAGRAPVVILSGGGAPRATEAGKMADAIVRLGVPRSALVLESRSRSTRDNARLTALLAERSGMQRVLLVTSSVHMPRARLLFQQAGIAVVPVPVPERVARPRWQDRWLPSRSALWRSSRALKEFAGLALVRLQG